MAVTLTWTDGMHLEAQAGENTVGLDAKSPLGKGSGMTPKELVAAGMGGCTAMDVIALLKKHKQTFESLEVEVDTSLSKGVHPTVFTEAVITFKVAGELDKEILLESVNLSLTKYCGVNAMLSKAFPIRYVVLLNNEEIGQGKAEFN